MSEPHGAEDQDLRLVPVDGRSAEAKLRGTDLSDRFHPFLSRFAAEAVASGGEAKVAEARGEVVGLLVSDLQERTASAFSRSAGVAEALRRSSSAAAVYAERDLAGPREVFQVYSVPLSGEPPHRFRHRVRVVSPSELGRVAGLLREAYGSSPERWLAAAYEADERCLAVEVDGLLAGVGFVLVVGRQARLHTLTVRAGYRGTGVGTDLLVARLWFARSAGAREAFSEISERNAASRAVAERVGMRAVDRLFLYPGPGGTGRPGPAGPFPTGAPSSS